jgi:hypothetical protein
MSKKRILSLLLCISTSLFAQYQPEEEQAYFKRFYFKNYYSCVFGTCSKETLKKNKNLRHILFDFFAFKKEQAESEFERRRIEKEEELAYQEQLEKGEQAAQDIFQKAKKLFEVKGRWQYFNASLLSQAAERDLQTHPEIIDALLDPENEETQEVIDAAARRIAELADYGYEFEGNRRWLGLHKLPYIGARNEDPFDPSLKIEKEKRAAKQAAEKAEAEKERLKKDRQETEAHLRTEYGVEETGN